jgi:hypothetical protein
MAILGMIFGVPMGTEERERSYRNVVGGLTGRDAFLRILTASSTTPTRLARFWQPRASSLSPAHLQLTTAGPNFLRSRPFCFFCLAQCW